MNEKLIHKLSTIICWTSLALLWVDAIIFYQKQTGRILAVVLAIICLITFYVSDYTDEKSIFF